MLQQKWQGCYHTNSSSILPRTSTKHNYAKHIHLWNPEKLTTFSCTPLTIKTQKPLFGSRVWLAFFKIFTFLKFTLINSVLQKYCWSKFAIQATINLTRIRILSSEIRPGSCLMLKMDITRLTYKTKKGLNARNFCQNKLMRNQ